MTRNQQLAWVFLPSAAVVTLGLVAVQTNLEAVRDAGRFLLLPGYIFADVLTGDLPARLSGIRDWVVVSTGSLVGWAVVSRVLLSAFRSLTKSPRRDAPPRRRLLEMSVMAGFFGLAFLFLTTMYIRVNRLPSATSSRGDTRSALFRSPNGTILSGLCALLCAREVWLAGREQRKKRPHRGTHEPAAGR